MTAVSRVLAHPLAHRKVAHRRKTMIVAAKLSVSSSLSFIRCSEFGVESSMFRLLGFWSFGLT